MMHASTIRKIYGLILRHVFLLGGSWPRIIEMLYWPTLTVLTWGFMNTYLTSQPSALGLLATSFLGGALLLEFLTRSNTGLLVTFLEEVWSRNLGHLFLAPLRPWEFALGAIVISALRVVFAMIPCLILTALCFDFWLPSLGAAFFGFSFCLAMTGWAISLLILCLLLKFGTGVEWLAWMACFLITPIVGAFYPVTILPDWLQTVSWLLPPTYVFEGFRGILNHGAAPWDLLLKAFGLNLIYLAIGLWAFFKTFDKTRQTRGLLQALE